MADMGISPCLLACYAANSCTGRIGAFESLGSKLEAEVADGVV